MRKIKLLTNTILVSVFFINLSTLLCASGTKSYDEFDVALLSERQKDLHIEMIKDSLAMVREDLIEDVRDYIDDLYPASAMDPELMVDICLQYKFDITLMMAQAQQESGFGVAGFRPFGDMRKKYNDPNLAIEPYVGLMLEYYLRTKTVDEALNTGLYVNGSRKYKYAGHPSYCTKIKKIRNNIHNTTDIFDNLNNYFRLSDMLDSL